ncbi:MAG: tRNA pseudouridine(38-40) synthase TruA [Bryobacterales bacterium]|nr:tRNA pseudouridine(38-40) synthase TruA [Bryobacterales bacterium]
MRLDTGKVTARRLKFSVAYDGTAYHGWQVQPGLETIQGVLQRVLGEIEGAAVLVAGSGRTDAGVHAEGQVAAATLNNPIPAPNLGRAMNRLLPRDIRVLTVEEAAPDFDPRRHAIAKTYEYRIARDPICWPCERLYVFHHPYPLDEAAMARLAPLLAGTHDFSAFAAVDDRDALGLSKVRTIFSSQLWREAGRLIYRVRGSGFLKHMVRNIVGTLLEAGKGNVDEAQLRAMLEPGYPRKAPLRAPASGLFLLSVEYPAAAAQTPGLAAGGTQSTTTADA